jgi:hypothetical protein
MNYLERSYKIIITRVGCAAHNKERKTSAMEIEWMRVYDRDQLYPIDGVLSLTLDVDLSLIGCRLESKVESTRDSENIATAARVVNNQVNQGTIAA